MDTFQATLVGVEVAVGAAAIAIPEPATTGTGVTILGDGLRRFGDAAK